MDSFVRVLNPILMILFGLGAGIVVSRQRNVTWRLYGIGALTFIGSQVLHIPFNAWVLNPMLGDVISRAQQEETIALIILAIALGLSAGVFEETSRYLVYRFWIRQSRSWKDGLMFGAGHGGIEAILLGILTLFTVINIFALANQDLSTVIPEGQLPLAIAQIEAFWAVPWYEVLLGAAERLIAVSFHIAASLLVLQVFRRRQLIWLFGAIGLHTLLNALAVYGASTWGTVATEGVLAVFGVACIGIIFWLRPKEQEEPPDLDPPPLPELQQAPVTNDQVEDSKYA